MKINWHVEPTKIWKRPCPKCPTAHYPSTPDAEDMLEGFKAGKVSVLDMVFRCAWRPQKMCKGICDYAGITEADLG